MAVNCGALPGELIEAELFGAEAGAYTGANKAREGRFEMADGGTLFLDEIGNLPLPGQMKLLRVLETGQFERFGIGTYAAREGSRGERHERGPEGDDRSRHLPRRPLPSAQRDRS